MIGEAGESIEYRYAWIVGGCVRACGLMLGAGMTDEQKNADAWDMEGRTESTIPSVAIVHIGGEK